MKIVTEEEKDDWIREGETNKPIIPLWRKIVNWFCGLEAMTDSREPVFTQDEANNITEAKAQEVNLYEDLKQKIIVNVCAATALVVTTFFCAFFA